MNMFSTQTQFTTKQNNEGRKKFGIGNKISNELRRVIRQSTNWVYHTPADLLKLFEYDSNRRYMPVRGNTIVRFNYTLSDVLSLMRTFQIQFKESHHGRKLALSPIFSKPDSTSVVDQELDQYDSFPYFSAINSHDSALCNTVSIMEEFSSRQTYNINGAFRYAIADTYMTCLYEFLNLLTTTSKRDIEEKLFTHFNHVQFKRLDAYGVYMFLLHLRVRGVAKLDWYYKYQAWRKGWASYNIIEKQQILNSFYKGENSRIFNTMQEMMIDERKWFYSIFAHEAKLIRYSTKITGQLFNPRLIYYLTWKNAILDQMTPTERYRDSLQMPLSHLHGEPTMFRIKDNINEAVDENIPKVQSAIQDSLKELLKSPEIKESVTNLVTDSMIPTLENFEKSSEKVSNSVLDNLKTSMAPLIEQTFSLFSTVNGLIDFMKSMLKQALDAFPKELFGTKMNLDISPETLLNLLKYYIIYVNVESKPLKIALIYLMLREVGLLEYLIQWGGNIFNLAFGSRSEVPLDGSEIKGEPTSGIDWLSNLADMIFGHKNEIALCSMFTALLVMIFKHTCGLRNAGTMRFNEYTTIAGMVIGMCKGFHWVGSGMFGIDRIYKYFVIISKSVTSYIQEHILGITEQAMTNEKAVARWLVKLKFFSTDTGRNAIRVSEDLLKVAERIMSEGLAFLTACSKDPKFISRESLMVIHRNWNDVKTLSNYTYRIRSTSNFKPAMFHVQFVGEPGIGKSTLTEKFIASLSKKIYREDKNITHWTYNPNVDHFDGYNGQTYMIIDDLFRYNEPKHLSLVIGLITNTPVPLPMAHLEDKGVHLDSDILISSTNVPYPIGKDIFCMEAVHRRRHVLCEVKMDPRVKADGKFSKQLFEKFYPNQNSFDFPHLKFALMKPVINPGEEQYQSTTSDEMEWKHNLIKKLRTANETLKFNEDFFFGPDARPLKGMTVPCTNWTFDTFVENVAVSYQHLRSGEQKLTVKEKYEHVMECFAEIDNIFVQSDDISDGVAASTTFKLISDKFLDASLQYGMDDPLGKRVYAQTLDQVLPDMCDLDIDGITQEFLDSTEGMPTAGTVDDDDWESSYGDPNEFLGLTLTDEEIKLEKLTEHIRSHDLTGPERDLVLLLMHKCAMKEHFTISDYRYFSYLDGKAPNPFPKEAYQDIVPGNPGPETSRRQRIMQKLNKRIIDPLIKEQMVVKLVHNSEGNLYPAIPIWSYYTNWGCSESGTFPGENFYNYLQSDQVMESSYQNYKTRFMWDKPKMMSFFKQVNSEHKFYYPNRKPYSDEHIEQGNSRISIEFLRRLSYVDGDWHMDVSDLDFHITNSIAIKKNLNNIQKTYHIPLDIAFFCSINQSFTYTANLFSLLSAEEQRDMVSAAKWQYEHMYSLSREHLRERILSIVHTVKRVTLAHVYRAVGWVWNKLSTIVSSFLKIAAFAGTVYLLKQVGKLFFGSSEPTSKFMHRSNIKSNLMFRGRPQAGIFDPSNTQQILAQKYLDKHIKFFHIVNEDGLDVKAHGIHTKQFLILNSHTTIHIKGPTILSYTPTVNSDKAWEIEISRDNVFESPGNDLAIIFSRHLPMASDITNQFITNEDFEQSENIGELWSLTNYENQQSVEIRDRCVPHKKVTMTANDGARGEMSMAIMVEGVTVGGKSGSMLMSASKRPGHRSIVGIQAWKVSDYYKQTIVYQVVTQELLSELMQQVEKQVKRPVITQEGPILCEPTSSKVEGIVDSHINICGSVPAEHVVGMVARTAFKKTIIAHEMDKSGKTSPRVPAALNPHDHRLLVHAHPMQHSVNKHGTGKVGSFDLAILNRATEDMAYWLRDRLDKQSFDCNLDFETCVTGIREPGSNPVNCSKSAGLPYVLDKYHGKPKGKKAYVEITEEGQCKVNDPEFIKSFEATFSKLQQGIIPKHSSYDFPKDELRPYYKALGDPVAGTLPKTRSVTCMNMEMIFSWRRVTLDLMASLHRAARGDFPFGPGINPEGPDWTRLFHYLNKHPNCLDFDVSNWDGHMPPELLLSVADMLCIILRVSFDSPTAKVIYSLLTEVLFGHVQFEDMVYQKCRGLISGFPGTAEVNTLVHLLLMYYFYLYIADLTENQQYANIHDFFYYTSPVFYGDDVIMSVAEHIIPWFNGNTISRMYIEHGYPVTTASKTKEMPKSKNIFECTFLKSGFNYINPSRVDRLMDISVCYDLMYWVRAKEHPYDQFRSNLFDSFRLIHGHGPNKYNEVRDEVNQWLRECNLEPFDYRWEDFEKDKIQKYYSE
ncbi:putative non-structural polyprotein [Anoplolepis gracilipes virus 3]|nr:putative non-structural polyprotein [Anoplolepis gracilipes virus 3]